MLRLTASEVARVRAGAAQTTRAATATGRPPPTLRRTPPTPAQGYPASQAGLIRILGSNKDPKYTNSFFFFYFYPFFCNFWGDSNHFILIFNDISRTKRRCQHKDLQSLHPIFPYHIISLEESLFLLSVKGIIKIL